MVIVEEDCGWGFLVIRVITGVKDLDTRFAVLFEEFWGNSVARKGLRKDKRGTRRRQYRNRWR